MILLTLEWVDKISLLGFPSATSKWTELATQCVSITISKGINAHQKSQSFSFHVGENVY